MTIDELCRKAAEAVGVPKSLHVKRDAGMIKDIIGPELAARDDEIESLRSQLASAWRVIHRLNEGGVRDKPEVAMVREDLDAAIAGACAARDAEIVRLERENAELRKNVENLAQTAAKAICERDEAYSRKEIAEQQLQLKSEAYNELTEAYDDQLVEIRRLKSANGE